MSEPLSLWNKTPTRQADFPHTTPFSLGLTGGITVGVETLDVGVDALTPVSKAYEHKRPFWFTGKIEKVRFDFGDSIELSPEEKLKIKLAMD